MKETNDGFQIQLMVPGFKKEDLQIKVNNNILSISAEVKETQSETTEKFTRKEFTQTSFQRSFTLPKTVVVENISAEYDSGILNLFVPKSEPAKEKAPIEIKVA